MNVALLWIVLGFGTGIFAGHLNFVPSFLRPKPPTAQLTALQTQLEQASADAKKALAEKDATAAKERSELLAMFEMGYESSLGAEYLLSKIDATHATPQSTLAAQMVSTANKRLQAALGKTEPPEVIKAIADEMDGLISQRDAAIKERDESIKKFDVLQATHNGTLQLLTVKNEQVKTSQEHEEKVQSQVTEKTNEVKTVADKLDAEKRNSGSLLGSLGSAWHWIEGLAVVAVIILAVALYLRVGLGSVGKGLHAMEADKILSADDYKKVVSYLDTETDKAHQWLIRTGKPKT